MSYAWTVATMLASLIVLARMAGHLNRMHLSCVPCGVIASIVIMGVGAGAYLISPFYGAEYVWRDFLFSGSVAVWSWLDRRYPCDLLNRQSSQQTSEVQQ